MHKLTSMQQRPHTEWVPNMHWGGRQDFKNWNSLKEEGHQSDDIVYHSNNDALYHDNSEKCFGTVSLRAETVWIWTAKSAKILPHTTDLDTIQICAKGFNSTYSQSHKPS